MQTSRLPPALQQVNPPDAGLLRLIQVLTAERYVRVPVPVENTSMPRLSASYCLQGFERGCRCYKVTAILPP